MMKKYYGVETTFYVGETNEIKAVYKSIRRASREYKTDLFSAFCDPATFSERKNIYALEIESTGKMSVLSSDTMMELIVSGVAIEYTDKTDANIQSVNDHLRKINSRWYALTERKLCAYIGNGKFQERDFSDFESMKAFINKEF